MLEFVAVSVGSGGRSGCSSCAPESGAEYASVNDVVERVRASAGADLVLCGPEPFSHPGLPTIVAAARDEGVRRIAVETDGAALSVRSNAEGVLHAGVRHLRVRVIDGDQRAARTRDALAGVRAYLQAADAAGVTVAVTAIVPVCRHNLADLTELVSTLAATGFHAARLEPEGSLPGPAASVIAAACDTGMVNRLWVETDPALPLPETHALHAVPAEVRHV